MKRRREGVGRETKKGKSRGLWMREWVGGETEKGRDWG